MKHEVLRMSLDTAFSEAERIVKLRCAERDGAILNDVLPVLLDAYRAEQARAETAERHLANLRSDIESLRARLQAAK